MIASRDSNPQKDHYFLGALVLEILLEDENEDIEFLTVYEKIKNKENISTNLLLLTLDWLYIIGAIETTSNGWIKKCF
ncbi:MAG: ABC-three component system middle component 6 [Thalassolituus sp.]|jgi:hypothetical protein